LKYDKTQVKLNKIRKLYREELQNVYSADEADFLFFEIFRHVTGNDRHHYFLQPDAETAHERFLEILERLKRYEPVQYITGETVFADLQIAVNTHTLIPRPETEELAYLIRDFYKSKQSPEDILDIGTGTGAIALALKKFFPASKVTGMDYKSEILDLAQANARRNGLQIEWVRGDVLKGEFPEGPFDLIVSNPPYIPVNEKDTLMPQVKNYEPPEALFVQGDNPLIFYEKITDFFKAHAKPGGQLFFEIHEEMQEQLKKMLEEKGLFSEFYRDLRNKPRFLRIWKP